MELKGKLAIITGGNRGIGRGIAEALAQVGSNIAVVYRKNVEAFEDLKSYLEPSGIQLTGNQVDIVDFADVEKTFSLSENPYVSRVRLGAHEEFIRFVLDVETSYVPQYRLEKLHDDLRIIVGKSAI